MAQQEHKEHVVPNVEGTIFGYPGPAIALVYLILIALIVMISVWIIGDPNPLG
jgi:hypothetical protein